MDFSSIYDVIENEDGTVSLILRGTEEPQIVECIHEWKKYEGFTDVFDYCVKCDIKNR